MSTIPDQIPAERRGISLQLPRPLWIGLATALAVAVAVGVQVVVPMWREQTAIREIRRVGGRRQIEPGGPDWLRKRVGDEWMAVFDRVVKVELTVKSARDPVLGHLAALKNVKVLWLGNSQISDEGLVNVRELYRLEQLWLGNTRVTDAGLVNLQRLSKLREVSLANTRVSDAGLVHLHGLTGLRQLSVRNTQVTPTGTAELRRLLPDLRIDM